MLLRSSLRHITIIILRPILHLVYLCPCLGLDLFMSYLCILFLFFSLIVIVINHITSYKQVHLFSCTFLENLLLFLNENLDEEGELFSNSRNSTWHCCLAFAWIFANFSLALLIKVLLIKKVCIYSRNRDVLEMLINSMKHTFKGFSRFNFLLTRKKCGTTLYSNYSGFFGYLLRMVPVRSALFEKWMAYFL